MAAKRSSSEVNLHVLEGIGNCIVAPMEGTPTLPSAWQTAPSYSVRFGRLNIVPPLRQERPFSKSTLKVRYENRIVANTCIYQAGTVRPQTRHD